MRGSYLLGRGLPLTLMVVRKGISAIYSGRSMRALFYRLRTLSLRSSLISGSMVMILLLLRSSSSRVRMVNTSLGM